MNYGEAPNVDTKFHCGRAEQSADGFATDFRVVRLGFLLVGEPIGAKAILTVCAVFCLDVAGVVLGAEALRGGEAAVHIAEEFVRAGGLLFVGPPLNGIGFYILAIAEAPEDSVNAKAEDRDFFVLFVASLLLNEIIRSFKLPHQEQNEILVAIPFEIVEVDSMLLREVFEVLAEAARRPQALRNQAGRFV
jgi:hypothetical protein